MRLERRKAPRYPFTAMAEIVDQNKALCVTSRVSDLSLHGCYVETADPFPQGTNVLIEIYTKTEFLETHATVVFLEPQQGMGLTFTEMPECFTSVLNLWLEQAQVAKGQ